MGITKLQELVDTKIKPAMVEALQEAVGGNTVAVISFTPELDPTTNVLRVGMEALSQPGGNLLERTLITQDQAQSNEILRKAYLNGSERDQPVPSEGANLFGQPLVKIPRAWHFTTAGSVRRRISDTRVLIGTAKFARGGGGAGAGAGDASAAGAGAQGGGGGTREAGPGGRQADDETPNAMVVGRQFGIRNSVRGFADLGVQIPVTEVLSLIELEFFDPISGAPSGGSGVGGTRTRGSAGSEG